MVYFPANFEIILSDSLDLHQVGILRNLKGAFSILTNELLCAHWHGYYGPVTHSLFTCMYLNF